MPLLADRVRETSATTGTGTLTLAGAVAGYQGFNAAFANADTVYYVIQYATEWEVGIGTVGTGTLSRDSVLSSSNADALVPFSAGTKDVFVAYVAERAVTTSDAATLTNKTIDDITNLVGADHIHYKIKANATITKGQTLKAVGYNAGAAAIEVEPISSAADIAVGIAYQDLASGAFGAAINTGLLIGVKTDFAGWALGDVLYPDPATGGLTKTKPTSGTYQACAYIMRVQSNNGVLLCEFTEPQQVMASTNTANTGVLRDGSGNFAAGTITAALTGNASTATALQTARAINGVNFDGTAAITVTAAAGTLSGATLAAGVTASSLTSVGTLGSLTVTNPITGSVTGSSGSTTGNAATATTLQTARNINGVSFNGSADITVTAAAGTLTGSTLASGVTASSLTSVGTLSSLAVTGNATLSNAGATLTLGGSSKNGSIRVTGATMEFRDASSGVNIATLDLASGTYSAPYGATFGTISGNVGIGTASPLTKVHINNGTNRNILITSDATQFGSSGMAVGSFTDGAAGYAPLVLIGSTVQVAAGGSIRTTIDTSGNLGLGVTPNAGWGSSEALQFVGGSAFGRRGMSYNAYFDGSAWKYIGTGAAVLYQQDSGGFVWYTAASGTVDGSISLGNPKLTLDASGNLSLREAGAGFTNGGVIRDVNGSTGVRFYGASDGNLTLFNTVDSASFGNIVFSTNNGTQAERARITSAGSVVAGGSVALATTATDGFLYVPTCAGAPTGTPTAITGMAPIIVDTTNHKLYFFSGGTWRDAGP